MEFPEIKLCKDTQLTTETLRIGLKLSYKISDQDWDFILKLCKLYHNEGYVAGIKYFRDLMEGKDVSSSQENTKA